MSLQPQLRFIRNSKNSAERGSAILWVLVGSSVIVIWGLATLAMLVTSVRDGESIIARQHMANLVSQIDSILKNERSCRVALGGALNNCYSDTHPTYCPLPDGALSQNVDPTLNTASHVRIYRNGAGDILFTEDPGPDPDRPLNEFGVLKISSITLTPIVNVGGDVYFARLGITAVKPVGTTGSFNQFGKKELFSSSHMVSLRIRPGTGKVYSCTGLSMNIGEQRPLPICMPGQGLFSTEGQVRCAQMICPAGQHPVLTADGLTDTDSAGNIRCI